MDDGTDSRWTPTVLLLRRRWLDVRWCMLWFSGSVDDNDAMCDDACCDFWPRDYKNSYRTSTGVDSVDVRWCMLWFSGQENTKTAIAHRPTIRLGRCAMMHVVIFWPRDTNRYRTSTDESTRSKTHTQPFCSAVQNLRLGSINLCSSLKCYNSPHLTHTSCVSRLTCTHFLQMRYTAIVFVQKSTCAMT